MQGQCRTVQTRKDREGQDDADNTHVSNQKEEVVLTYSAIAASNIGILRARSSAKALVVE